MHDLPRSANCNINCKNLYACHYTCHECCCHIKNGNRCDQHCKDHEDSRLLVCPKCLEIRNDNLKCFDHRLVLGQVDPDPIGDHCTQCKNKYEAYIDSDKFQVYTDDNDLSFCERHA